MTHSEARDLAVRIRETWTGGGPSVDVWIEELEPLDAGTAGTTLVRLRREEERAPSIAKFLATYRALATPHNVDRPKCELCDCTGWVQTDDLLHGDPDNGGQVYSQVVPCLACEYGAQAKRVLPTILKTNGYGRTHV